MALFQTQKMEVKSPYRKIDIGDGMRKGEQITIVVSGIKERNSNEYGAFQVVEGVSFDLGAKSVDAAVETANLISFIANTQLRNLIADGTLRVGSAYLLTKKWAKGEKFSDGNRAKGHGFEVQKILMSDADASKFLQKEMELIFSDEEAAFKVAPARL